MEYHRLTPSHHRVPCHQNPSAESGAAEQATFTLRPTSKLPRRLTTEAAVQYVDPTCPDFISSRPQGDRPLLVADTHLLRPRTSKPKRHPRLLPRPTPPPDQAIRAPAAAAPATSPFQPPPTAPRLKEDQRLTPTQTQAQKTAKQTRETQQLPPPPPNPNPQQHHHYHGQDQAAAA